MNNLEKAKIIKKKYDLILDRLSHLSTNGDKEAPLLLIQKLTEYTLALKAVGYRQTDEDESPPNKLVKITDEYLAESKRKNAEIENIMDRIRKGDKKAINDLSSILSKG